MTRPASHQEQEHRQRCGNCIFSRLVAYKLDLLCFLNDNIEIQGQSHYPVDADHVILDGQDIGILDSGEYDKVWSGRIVDSDDVCDEWEGYEKTMMKGKEVT